MKKYLIATACDHKVEDFLTNHWYRSLRENVDLSQTDVLIIDWGLSEKIKRELEEKGVLVWQTKYKHQGLINNMRFMDLHDFLQSHSQYEQVILCDGGDIIFQSDISHLFELKPNRVKGVTEGISPNMDVLMNEKKIKKANEIITFLKGRKLLNVGLIVYPTRIFLDMVKRMFDFMTDKNSWGAETILLNYLIYNSNFYEIDSKYNFIPTTSTRKFYVRDSVFYFEDGEIIPIVHNAGNKDFFRSIQKFGYGPGHNKVKKIIPFILKAVYKTMGFFRRKHT